MSKGATVPGVIRYDPSIGAIRVAALTLLDRLVVTLHRAGCRPITVVGAAPLPSLKRSEALGIPIEIAHEMPGCAEPTLIAFAEVIVKPADVKRLIDRNGRLLSRTEEPLPVGLVQGGSEDPRAAFERLPSVRAEDVAERVTNHSSAARAEKLLWASLVSDTDGLVDTYFNRPIGRWLSKILIHTPISPNQITVVSMLIGLLSAFAFGRGSYGFGIFGAVLLQLSATVDCIDGDIARMVFKETRIGKWLDLCADQVVHVAVFAAIAMGAGIGQFGNAAWLLGGSLVFGALASFAVVLRGMLAAKAAAPTKVQRFIDKATSRDFSVLLLAFALIDRLWWFLWVAAIGVHFFWLTVLYLQTFGSRQQSGAGRSAPG